MSPEERACDLLNRYSLVWGLETASDRGLQSMIEAIATAIREAENAKLEELAQRFEDMGFYCLPLKDASGVAEDLREVGYPRVDEARLPDRIRSLKPQKETP